MCGRFTLKSPGRTKFDCVNRSHLPPLFPRYNIAPSQSVFAIVQHGTDREAELLQWGLIPSWNKEATGFINARAETLEDKPSFSKSFDKRRCLIPADGFYDGRAMSLHLTASGEKLKKAVPAVEAADEEFLKKLNTKNQERFIECLIELNPNMS